MNKKYRLIKSKKWIANYNTAPDAAAFCRIGFMLRINDYDAITALSAISFAMTNA